jgi:hypothetical protein
VVKAIDKSNGFVDLDGDDPQNPNLSKKTVDPTLFDYYRIGEIQEKYLDNLPEGAELEEQPVDSDEEEDIIVETN